MDAEINRVIATTTISLPSFMNGFFSDLLAMLHVLTVEPIEEDSGRQEIIYRPGHQKTHQERENEIITGLSALPKLTARVRLNTFPATLTSRVCQCCAKPMTATALFCQECGIQLHPEYLITIKPINYGMKIADLNARIAGIVGQNLRDGYVRKRADVEAEIQARQQPPPPPAAPQPAIPPKPPPTPAPAQQAVQPPAPPKPFQAPPPLPQARRKVPKQKVCPDCATANDPVAIFCMHCGKKLY